MREIQPGIYRVDADESDAFDARREELHAMIEKLVEEQRARLTASRPEYSWWADVVFGLRDIKSTCTMLQLDGNDAAADMLAEIVGKTALALLSKLPGADFAKVKEISDAMQQECQMLDAVMGQAVAKFQGEQEQ